MRKAKSLLALVLAMLTLLAFLPTALADETPHAVKLTHGEHVSVKGEAPTTTIAGADLVIEYKSDNAEFVPDKPTVTIGGDKYTDYNLTEADTDGYRKLTISIEALTGNVTIHLKASGKMYPVKIISEEGTTNMPGDATAAYGSTYTLPQNGPARTGKAFKGWKAVNGGTYQPGGTYTSIPSGGETFTQDGMTFTIDSITLSPVAYKVDYTVDSEVVWSNSGSGRQSEEDRLTTQRYFENVEILLTLTDGTVIDLSNAGGSIGPEDGVTVCSKGEVFSEVLPMEDMASISVGGVVYDLTAE